MKVVREKDSLLAVVVNVAATRQAAEFICQTKTSGQIVLQNGKQIEVKESVVTLPLEPFGVEIIRWINAP